MTKQEIEAYALKLYPVKTDLIADNKGMYHSVDTKEPEREAYIRGRLDETHTIVEFLIKLKKELDGVEYGEGVSFNLNHIKRMIKINGN